MSFANIPLGRKSLDDTSKTKQKKEKLKKLTLRISNQVHETN